MLAAAVDSLQLVSVFQLLLCFAISHLQGRKSGAQTINNNVGQEAWKQPGIAAGTQASSVSATSSSASRTLLHPLEFFKICVFSTIGEAAAYTVFTRGWLRVWFKSESLRKPNPTSRAMVGNL